MAIVKRLVCVIATAAAAVTCSAAERPAAERIAGRDFPSVFQAWSAVQGVAGDELEKVARHDLMWHGVSWFGLRWDRQPSGLGKQIRPESIASAMARRRRLLELNPNIILIAEVRYRDAHRSFLGDGHKWWARDRDGKIEAGWEEGGFWLLDFKNPEYREHVAGRAGALAKSGVLDGLMLDWWVDDEYRLDLVRRVREAVGEDFLIIVNANDRKTPMTGSYINGFFMECYRSETAEDWKRIAETLDWASKNLRQPRINCLESWYHRGRDDLNLMRATTTLSLTHSNGYCLFSDPNPLPSPDHLHNWYGFWDAKLGRPTGEGVKRADGSTIRRFDNGWAVYNPMGNGPVTVMLEEPASSAATGKVGTKHMVGDCDGDIFLRTEGQ